MQMVKIDTIILTQKEAEKFEMIQNYLEASSKEKFDNQDVALQLIRLGMVSFQFI